MWAWLRQEASFGGDLQHIGLFVLCTLAIGLAPAVQVLGWLLRWLFGASEEGWPIDVVPYVLWSTVVLLYAIALGAPLNHVIFYYRSKSVIDGDKGKDYPYGYGFHLCGSRSCDASLCTLSPTRGASAPTNLTWNYRVMSFVWLYYGHQRSETWFFCKKLATQLSHRVVKGTHWESSCVFCNSSSAPLHGPQTATAPVAFSCVDCLPNFHESLANVAYTGYGYRLALASVLATALVVQYVTLHVFLRNICWPLYFIVTPLITPVSCSMLLLCVHHTCELYLNINKV